MDITTLPEKLNQEMDGLEYISFRARPIFRAKSQLVSGSVFCHFRTLFLGTVVHWINLGDCKLG